ncbi:MAG TPA: hypothetical protein VGC45_15745 [Gryllotalpicola sp.]
MSDQESPLATLEEVSRAIWRRVTPPGDVNQGDVLTYIESAVPVMEDICGPIIQREAIYTRDGGRPAIVLPAEFTAVTQLLEDGTASSDFTAAGEERIIYAGTSRRPRIFNEGIRNISATVTIGMETIPSNIRLAARILIAFMWRQDQQATTRPQLGDVDPDNTARTPQGFLVPRRVITLCAGLVTSGDFA